MKKKALIVGIYGQDGSYLAELLIKKKYFVYGIVNKLKKRESISTIKNVKILNTSINNYKEISNLIKKIKPNEIYHLGSNSFINYDFDSEFFKLNPNLKLTLDSSNLSVFNKNL